MRRLLVATATGGGKNICMTRIQKGLSMRALAAKAGISVTAISKMERGTVQSIRPLSAQKICTALEVPFDSLFTIGVPEADGAGNHE